MTTTGAEKVRDSFDLAITLLGISLNELKAFSLLELSKSTADDLQNSLQVIEQITRFDKELREYLNKVDGRRKSKKVKELIEALSNSLEKLSEVDLPEKLPFSKRIDKIRLDLDEACPNNEC